jgi:hypothetical protein
MDVPKQVKGKQSDNEACVVVDDPQSAGLHFSQVKERLLNVNQWKDISGPQSASFVVHNERGEPLDRQVQVGDYIRIKIPGPGLSTGNGYDWVKVLDITESRDGDTEQVTMMVKPSDNPQNSTSETAHFFDESATSTFIVKREGRTLTAEVHGRNEETNKEITQTIDKLRNTLVAAGATTVFSDIQWRKLAESLVKL